MIHLSVQLEANLFLELVRLVFLLQETFDRLFEFDVVVVRSGTRDAAMVDEKLAREVPRHSARIALLEPGVDGVRVVAVHVDLVEHGKLNVVLANERFDRRARAVLLKEKLIARKGENLEALIAMPSVEIDELLVLAIGLAA